MNFNEKLQKLRKEKKYSQEELADMLDVTRQSVSKWESGQTYPEMDKLLAICKIFGCTLEELTNDTIKLNEFAGEKKSKVSDITSSVEVFIEKTYHYFTGSTFKDILKCLIIMFVVYLFLCLCKYPFDALKGGLYNFFNSFMDGKVLNFCYSFFNLIINILYYSLKLFVLAYVFKIGFLDKKDAGLTYNVKEDKESAHANEVQGINSTKTKQNYSIFDALVSIVMFFIKMFFLIGAIPLIFLFIFFMFALIILIYFMFRGVFFFSIFIGLVGVIMLNEIALEFIYNFIFDRSQCFKRMLITIIASLAFIGVAGGLFVIECSKYTYHNEESADLLISNNYSYGYNGKMYLDSDILNYYNVSYEVDDSLSDEVNVKVVNSKYRTSYDVKLDGSKLYLSVLQSDDSFSFSDIFDVFVKDLKNKVVYNYTLDDGVRIVVTSSEKNISTIKKNSEIKQKDEEKEINNQDIYDYKKKISELESQVDELERNNRELSDKIDDYKRKISALSE